MYYARYASAVGTLLLSCSDAGLTGIHMDRETDVPETDHPILRQTKCWLDAYFRGESLPVEIPLAPEGTAFQRQVWEILLRIPFGEIVSYGQIAGETASRMGKEKMSAQAVGQAVGKNPISILVPCHRVVGTQGQLTGYAGGLDRKQWLLLHEGWQIRNNTLLKRGENDAVYWISSHGNGTSFAAEAGAGRRL